VKDWRDDIGNGLNGVLRWYMLCDLIGWHVGISDYYSRLRYYDYKLTNLVDSIWELGHIGGVGCLGGIGNLCKNFNINFYSCGGGCECETCLLKNFSVSDRTSRWRLDAAWRAVN
jgi:hypothetical protein